MGLLKKAENTSAFLKLGIFGKAGSGKTFTSTNFAIGLHKYIKSTKPVAFLDSETGSDFMMKRFEKEKIDLLVSKSQAFSDLCVIIAEAEKTCDILIVDSITHFWNELMEAYKKKKNIKRIMMQHWMDLKTDWAIFSRLFINSKLHIIVAGRAGIVYETVENEDGTRESIVSGTKMKTEGEFGYEPSILIEMFMERESSQAGAAMKQIGVVLKDRTDTIMGMEFEKPKFENILSHVKHLNIGGTHIGVESRTSEGFIESDGDYARKAREKKIYLEEIESELIIQYGERGHAKEEKKKKLDELFGTTSWTKVESLDIIKLDQALKQLKEQRKGKIITEEEYRDKVISEGMDKISTADDIEVPF